MKKMQNTFIYQKKKTVKLLLLLSAKAFKLPASNCRLWLYGDGQNSVLLEETQNIEDIQPSNEDKILVEKKLMEYFQEIIWCPKRINLEIKIVLNQVVM